MTRSYLWLLVVPAGLLAGGCSPRTSLTAHRDGGTADTSPFFPSDDGTCEPPTSPCGSGSNTRCYDLGADTANCGACGHACLPGVGCVAGRCAQTLCTGPVAFHQISSAPTTLSGTSDRPGSSYLGADLDRDGQLDFVEYDVTGALALWLGQGDGSFTLTTRYPTVGDSPALASSFSHAAIADFNEDGLMDLVVSTSDETWFSFRPGLPGGGFGGQSGVPLRRDRIADLDRDGHLDLLFAHRPYDDSYDRFIVLHGRGDGTFVTGATYQDADDGIGYAGLWDWNGDGTLDLVEMGLNLHLRYGHGDGTFGDDQRCAVGGGIVVDLNGDGNLDLVWSLWDSRRIATVLGEGGCSFSPRIDYKVKSEQSGPIAIGDLTGDGVPDLMMGYPGNSTSLFVGIGDGTFMPPVELSIDIQGEVVIADVNRDGRADIVRTSDAGIVVYSNTCDR